MVCIKNQRINYWSLLTVCISNAYSCHCQSAVLHSRTNPKISMDSSYHNAPWSYKVSWKWLENFSVILLTGKQTDVPTHRRLHNLRREASKIQKNPKQSSNCSFYGANLRNLWDIVDLSRQLLGYATHKRTLYKKHSYRRDCARCLKRPFDVTQSRPLLCQSTLDTSTCIY